MLKVCWDDVELCKENLKTTYPPKLLELLFQCQLRFLAVYNVSRKLILLSQFPLLFSNALTSLCPFRKFSFNFSSYILSQEFHSISDLNILIKHCSRVNKIIIRTSRIRIRDLMLIKVNFFIIKIQYLAKIGNSTLGWETISLSTK